MNNKITAFRFAGALAPEQLSEAMKRVFAHLYSTGGITYSQFLFPYADSLLLSEDSADCFFGSHALLWEIEPERLMCSAEAVLSSEETDLLCPQVTEIELTARTVSDFLNDVSCETSGVGIGNFAALLSGNIRPWSLREHSRGLCSFAEHISRMKGYTAHGFSGGRFIVSADEELDELLLAGLYSSKTGGIAEFIKH